MLKKLYNFLQRTNKMLPLKTNSCFKSHLTKYMECCTENDSFFTHRSQNTWYAFSDVFKALLI